ncbi:DUF4190 domain-containing protein [Nocardioides marmotae]|uniref:DUF4190 domain-containing protein n=1 Tax=Nocardioides marmotae TaxID=2663857 RepID=UPI001323AB91|nr:DUF4190 domain-containing protein [Nocardioides marmotae]MBC9734677.1 DUF4190 domain-containing protein [Nocardioides marmotae]MTB85779.1 DUF4190 domain-containing protein [Nocardioides marmotae]
MTQPPQPPSYGGWPPPPGPQPGSFPQPPQPPQPPPTPGQATASLVLGVLSLTCAGFLTGVPAMILGRSAQREIAASGGRLGGTSVASAGFVTGLLGTIISVVGTAVVLALVIGVGVAIDNGREEIRRSRPVPVDPTSTCVPGGGTLGDPLLEDCRP